MTDPTIKSTLIKMICTTMLLTFLVGLNAVSDVNLSTNQADGIDGAKVSTVTAQRDPFWPVGYTPKWIIEKQPKEEGAMVKHEGTIDWNKAMEQVAIQGVSSRSGNEFFAVINGQIKSADETVSVEIESVNYTWMIEKISPPSSVKLRRVSAE